MQIAVYVSPVLGTILWLTYSNRYTKVVVGQFSVLPVLDCEYRYWEQTCECQADGKLRDVIKFLSAEVVKAGKTRWQSSELYRKTC